MRVRLFHHRRMNPTDNDCSVETDDGIIGMYENDPEYNEETPIFGYFFCSVKYTSLSF